MKQLILSYTIFVTVSNEFVKDYKLLKPSEIPHISYDRLKPATALKSLITPVTENATSVIIQKSQGSSLEFQGVILKYY